MKSLRAATLVLGFAACGALAQAPTVGGCPVFAGGGEHHWTTANERAVLVANFSWVDEGISGYLLP